MQERRESPRIRLRMKVGILLSSGEVHFAWTYDISLGGLQFLSDYSADEGTRLRIFFSVLDLATDAYVRVVVQTRVAYQIYDGAAGCNRIGLEFLEFEGRGDELYRQFLDARLYSRYGQRLDRD